MKGSLFREKGYAAFWSASFASAVGTWVQNIAAAILMLELTGSPLWVGMVGFASFGPTFLLAIPAGGLADRRPRSRIIIVTHLLSAGAAFALGVLAVTGNVTPLWLLVLVSVAGTGYAFAKPALQTLPAALVPEHRIREAVAATSSLFMVAQIVGPGLGGLLLAISGAGSAFLMNGVSYLLVAAAMPTIRSAVRSRPGAEQRRAARHLRDESTALRPYLRSHPYLRQLLSLVAVAACVTEGLRTLAPVYVVGIGANEAATGWLISAYGLGGLGSTIMFSRKMPERPPLVAALLGFFLSGAGLAVIGFSASLIVSLVAAVFVGVGYFFSSVTVTALVQYLVDDRFRGRVMSLHTMSSLGFRPFAALGIGALAAGTSVSTALVVWAGIATIGVGIVLHASHTPDGWQRWSGKSGAAA